MNLMDWEIAIIGIVTFVLLLYLDYSLIYPERF